MVYEFMIIPNEMNDAFFAGKRSSKVKFVINDTVHVTKGEFEGIEAAVISIVSLEPKVTYLLERFDRTGDITVPQSFIKLIIPSEVGAK